MQKYVIKTLIGICLMFAALIAVYLFNQDPELPNVETDTDIFNPTMNSGLECLKKLDLDSPRITAERVCTYYKRRFPCEITETEYQNFLILKCGRPDHEAK